MPRTGRDGKVLDPRQLEALSRELVEALPAGVREMQKDLEKHLRAVLEAGLARMDLVTREEFDVQREVLARTRARLEALERRVADLEAAQRQA